MSRKIDNIILLTTIFYLVIGATLSLLSFLSNSSLIVLNQKSILTEFAHIDYFSFFKTGLICLFISSFILYIGTTFCLMVLNLKMFIIEKWIVIITKIFSSISIIIPMTLTFSKEQFNVATTFVSFIALFSFAVPKTFQSKSSNAKVNVENTDRKNDESY
ncbi:hypothetical protein [Enterococcus lactis]|uniref:hypothetical protein n=1 Tax=Enterococcus lactis TaxID=357441 RepID=UPI0022E7E904|nr:hypothetical protein [Enterococcus lactis]